MRRDNTDKGLRREKEVLLTRIKYRECLLEPNGTTNGRDGYVADACGKSGMGRKQ